MSEFLQIAQVLADLSSLQNAEPAAARALLAANKDLSSSHTLRRKSRDSILPDPPKFDKFGRRILRAPPPLTRAGSSFSSSVNSSAVATSVATSPDEPDVDLNRVKKFLELYQKRDQIQATADTEIAKAWERIDKAKERLAKLEERERAAREKFEDSQQVPRDRYLGV